MYVCTLAVAPLLSAGGVVCDAPVCFPVSSSVSYMPTLIFSVQAAEVHWRVPMKTHTTSVWSRLCVTTLVEVTAPLNVFYAFFHWSVPEKTRRIFICIVSIQKKEKPKEGKQHFFFHKL